MQAFLNTGEQNAHFRAAAPSIIAPLAGHTAAVSSSTRLSTAAIPIAIVGSTNAYGFPVSGPIRKNNSAQSPRLTLLSPSPALSLGLTALTKLPVYLLCL